MPKHVVLLFSCLCLILLSSWGFYAHKRIAQMAIYALPPEMRRFYAGHALSLIEQSVAPDKRRYIDPQEGARHFLDCEDFGTAPFDSIPTRWKDALAKYGADSLNKSGSLPWQIEKTYNRLVQAFLQLDSTRIIRLSAELSHYIGDAHVPLHVTRNYNGQYSNQVGIHSFFESRIPELSAETYLLANGKTKYLPNSLDAAWEIIRESYTAKDSVFRIEKELSAHFPGLRKYEISHRKNVLLKTYSKAFSKAYEKALNGMIERRMRAAVYRTASFWYSAWVDAGQPDLNKFSRSGKSSKEKPSDGSKGSQKIYGRPDL